MTSLSKRASKADEGFSLVEVVIAMGICSFALVAILGLFAVGLDSVGESEKKLDAANLAVQVVGTLQTTPAGLLPEDFPIEMDLAQDSPPAFPTSVMIDSEGRVPSVDEKPSYKLEYRVWRAQGVSLNYPLIRVHLIFSWPPEATNPASHYELMFSVPER